MKLRLSLAIAAALVTWAVATTTQAQVCSVFPVDFTTPSTTSYVNGTGKCTYPGGVFSDVTSCNDSRGPQFTFSAACNVRQATISGWATWASPPFAEDPTPFVCFTFDNSIRITVVDIASAAGFELEPDNFGLHTFRVDFQDARGNVILTQSMTIEGSSGSRLFAAVCNEDAISDIIITDVLGDSAGFAFSPLRSDEIVGSTGATFGAPNKTPVRVAPNATRNAQ